MDSSKLELIQALHASPWKWVLALTGGGTQAAADLLHIPGGSRTVLEVLVPYGEEALAEFLGRPPDQYCSVETCRAMAARAYQRAAWLAPRQPVLGVAATASLATDRPKRGDHRFHITIHGRQHLTTHSLILNKGARSREEEEAVLDAVLLNALAEACGIAGRLTPVLRPPEALETTRGPAPGMLASFLSGECRRLCLEMDGRLNAAAAVPSALLPGSFNPIHEGHWRLAEVAARLLQMPVHFELSVVNVDKAPLRAEEIDARLRQFAGRAPLWLSRAPTFVEKAQLFPGVVFVIGADTAVRIVDPKYYGESEAEMAKALQRIRELGCRFLVAGRVDATGRFQGINDLALASQIRDLFTGIAEADYRADVSSSGIRNDAK
jgi:nicotinamide mononucleotide (NMN) deamidase PncC